MADEKLTNDQIEAVLQERLRIISALKAETAEGREALRIALAGDYAAAVNLERNRVKARGEP